MIRRYKARHLEPRPKRHGAAAAGTAAAIWALGPAAQAETHVVQPGETLSEIAGTYGTTVAAIAGRNHIVNPDFIEAGQRLGIGKREGAPRASASQGMQRIHVVRPGETLSAIASRYGTSVSVLASVNGLSDPNLIRAGQRLRIERSIRTLEAYEGLGAWIDVYDQAQWTDPTGTVQTLHDHGVQTLFVQTSNGAHGADIVWPYGMSRLVESAHAFGMRVVGWYAPSFVDPELDLRRAIAAVDYRTASGQGFDSVALDIESTEVRDLSVRTDRAVNFMRRLKDSTPGHFPLAAIVPDPIVQKYWPGFPYGAIAELSDAVLPMAYYSFHTSGYENVYRYIADDIAATRALTGSRPVHVIGGIAAPSSAMDVRALVAAAQAHGAIGASLYDSSTTRQEQWTELAPARLLR